MIVVRFIPYLRGTASFLLAWFARIRISGPRCSMLIRDRYRNSVPDISRQVNQSTVLKWF